MTDAHRRRTGAARLLLSSLLSSLLFAAVPTILVYGGSPFRWVCRRDGPRAGTCYAEPTLRHRLGLLPWDERYPRIGTMQIVAIIDLGDAHRAGDGWVRIRSSEECWKRWGEEHSWCYGSGFGNWSMFVSESSLLGASDERAFVLRFNAFLHDPSQRSFVHQPRGPYEPWHALLYLAAGCALTISVRRRIRARDREWTALEDMLPSTTDVTSVYRGPLMPSVSSIVIERARARCRHRPRSRRCRCDSRPAGLG